MPKYIIIYFMTQMITFNACKYSSKTIEIQKRALKECAGSSSRSGAAKNSQCIEPQPPFFSTIIAVILHVF